MEPRYDPRPASRFQAVQPRSVKVVTNRHERVAGVTWDLPADLRYVTHHESGLGRWGAVDVSTLRIPIQVASHDDQRVDLAPSEVLRLDVLL
jgi:hypothetical protein